MAPLEFVCWLLLGTAALYFGIKHWQLRRQVKHFSSALRQFYRSRIPPYRQDFKNRELASSWRLLLLLSSKDAEEIDLKEAYGEAMALSRRVAVEADEEARTAQVLVEVLMEQGKPEIFAAAVVVCDQATGAAKVLASAGLPKKRGEQAVAACVIEVLEEHAAGEENPSNDVSGVYAESQFSAFGVGLSLIVPLPQANGPRGALWLGLKSESSVLSQRRKKVVCALAEHAAASFAAAQRSQARTEQSNKERDFLLGLSHDLRSPGNAALYAARELLSGELGELKQEQKENVLMLERSISEQLSLLGDVMDYAKHQRGLLHAERKAVNVERCLRGLIEEYSLLASRKGLQFSADLAGEIWALVDSRHLRRITANFLSNAIKYSRQGKIELSLSRNKKQLKLMVADSGIGVPVEDQGLLFSEFQRGRNSYFCDGAGFGLVMTKALAELNGGGVFYKPAPGGGSIFGLTLELARIAGKYQDTGKIGTVVVLDDDAAACRQTIRYLHGLAERFIPASNSKEASEAVELFKPDLLISDFNLGEGSSESLLGRLSADLPILLLSGSAELELLKDRVNSSRFSVLEKPVSREDLRAAVAALFDQEGQSAKELAA